MLRQHGWCPFTHVLWAAANAGACCRVQAVSLRFCATLSFETVLRFHIISELFHVVAVFQLCTGKDLIRDWRSKSITERCCSGHFPGDQHQHLIHACVLLSVCENSSFSQFFFLFQGKDLLQSPNGGLHWVWGQSWAMNGSTWSSQVRSCQHEGRCALILKLAWFFARVCVLSHTLFELTPLSTHSQRVWNLYLLKEPICRSLFITAPSTWPKKFPVWKKKKF